MNVQEIYARLLHPYRPWLLAHDFEAIDPWIEIRSDGLADLCRYLRSEPDLKFDMLHCITAIDFWKPDVKKTEKGDVKGAAKGDSPILAGSKTGTVPGEKKGTVPDELPPHIELTYHLSSMKHRHKLVLKARIPRWLEDEPGLLPEIPSVSGVWSTADWHEREVFDLVGVYFLGHRDMRRILCPEDWEGHPLRRDYRMPAEYHGIPAR